MARGFSGGENQTLLLIKEHIRLGYQVSVVAKTGSPFAKQIAALDCRLIETPHYFARHTRALTRDIDCVHVHEGQAIYWALIQHLLFGVPYLVTRRIDNPLKNKKLSNLAYRRASVVVCISRAVEYEVKKCFPDKATALIHSSPVSYPLNHDRIREIKQKFSGKYLVIQAAKLLHHKGHDVTIKAAKLLAETDPDIQICILGDGPIEAELKQQAQGLANVEFSGQQSDIGNWFEAANVLIHPSHSEGLGSVILEATKAGLPVIGTRAGGIPDAIRHEQSGLLIEANQPRALADAITRLKTDQHLNETLAEGRKAFIADFDIQTSAQRYEKLYQQYAASHSGN